MKIINCFCKCNLRNLSVDFFPSVVNKTRSFASHSVSSISPTRDEIFWGQKIHLVNFGSMAKKCPNNSAWQEDSEQHTFLLKLKSSNFPFTSYILILFFQQVECYDAVKTIADKINFRDADMMSHVIMSVFKVASAEANVPVPHNVLETSSSCRKTLRDCFVVLIITFFCKIYNQKEQHQSND